MGIIIKSSDFGKNMLERINNAIVLCSIEPRLKKVIDEAGFKKISLNKTLAATLLKIDKASRPYYVADEAMKIVSSMKEPVFLTDYEMLFDPGYSIDVIRLFYELSRRMKIVVKWCGTVDDGHLVYAAPDYTDFHSYAVYDYDITCVI